MQDRRHQVAYLLITAFTLLQLVILFIFGYTPYPDSNGYLLIAEECIAHGEPYPVSTLLHDYPFLWNIGAINAVALSLKLFHSVTPLLILYSLMKGATAALFYAVTRKLTSSRVALIALILYVVYPANYGESTSTLSELPFMFFVMAGMYCSLVRKQSFVGGMLLAIANWFRPMAIIFLIALLVTLLFKWRKSIKLVAGYVCMIVIIGTATMMRTGSFLYQAKTGWFALSDYSTSHAEASMQVRERGEWDVSEKDNAWRTLFFDWLQEHLAEYVSQMPQKFVNTYVSDNVNLCTFVPDKREKEYMYEEVSLGTLISVFPHYSPVQWLTLLNLFIYYLFLLTACISLFHFRSVTHLLPVSVIALGTLLLLFFGHGEARFHIPFMPFFIMLAALFINFKGQLIDGNEAH